MIRVISWNNGETARAVSQQVSNGKLLSTTSTRSIPQTDVLVNFGLRNIDRDRSNVRTILNYPVAVHRASNKFTFFTTLRPSIGEFLPEFYTDKSQAIFHAVNSNSGIVVRHTVNGHGGEGIQVITADEMQTASDIPDAPLYTLLIKKRREYRIHIGRNSTGSYLLDITRKIHRDGIPITERGHVWNHGTGHIFTRESVLRDYSSGLLGSMIRVCKNAARILDLNFVAFDVVVEAGRPLESSNIYLLEANTAPGLEGFALKRYCEFFTKTETGEHVQPFIEALEQYMSQPNEEVRVSEE